MELLGYRECIAQLLTAKLPFQSAGPDQQLCPSHCLCQASLLSLLHLGFLLGEIISMFEIPMTLTLCESE